MKMIDLSHMMNVHTPCWVGYAGNKRYYAQNLQTGGIVAQRIDTAMHVGTHIDGAMHASDVKGDMGSYSLEFLVGHGAVDDISDKVDDWTLITPDMLESTDVEIHEGDILVLHTGFHRYYEGRPQQDLERYFCLHPGVPGVRHYNLINLFQHSKNKRQHRTGCPYSKDKSEGRKGEAANGVRTCNTTN